MCGFMFFWLWLYSSFFLRPHGKCCLEPCWGSIGAPKHPFERPPGSVTWTQLKCRHKHVHRSDFTPRGRWWGKVDCFHPKSNEPQQRSLSLRRPTEPAALWVPTHNHSWQHEGYHEIVLQRRAGSFYISNRWTGTPTSHGQCSNSQQFARDSGLFTATECMGVWVLVRSPLAVHTP